VEFGEETHVKSRLIKRDAQPVDAARKFGGVGNVSFGLAFQPGQGFLDQNHDFSRGEVVRERERNRVAVRAGRDNGGPVGGFGGEAGFENGLQRRLRVGGIVLPRAPNDAAHERNAADVHSAKPERQKIENIVTACDNANNGR